MAQRPRRILVVEDEFLVALDLQEQLSRLGCVCIGPVTTLADALVLTTANELIDAAILNVVVNGERVDALCDALEARGIRFGFASGMGVSELAAWRGHPCIQKPYTVDDVRGLVDRLLGRGLAQ
jgi:CheY-like chemotaxis protein